MQVQSLTAPPSNHSTNSSSNKTLVLSHIQHKFSQHEQFNRWFYLHVLEVAVRRCSSRWRRRLTLPCNWTQKRNRFTYQLSNISYHRLMIVYRPLQDGWVFRAVVRCLRRLTLSMRQKRRRRGRRRQESDGGCRRCTWWAPGPPCSPCCGWSLSRFSWPADTLRDCRQMTALRSWARRTSECVHARWRGKAGKDKEGCKGANCDLFLCKHVRGRTFSIPASQNTPVPLSLSFIISPQSSASHYHICNLLLLFMKDFLKSAIQIQYISKK